MKENFLDQIQKEEIIQTDTPDPRMTQENSAPFAATNQTETPVTPNVSVQSILPTANPSEEKVSLPSEKENPNKTSKPIASSPSIKNVQEPVAIQRQKPSRADVLAHIKESQTDYFKNHPYPYSKRKNIYNAFKLLIKETETILVDDIIETLKEIKTKEKYITREKSHVIVAKHGTISLRRYFSNENKKNIKKTSLSASKKTSKVIESETSSDSSSESASKSDSRSSNYESNESDTSEELEYKEPAIKSNVTINPQQLSSTGRIKATEEIKFIKLTLEKLAKVEKIAKKGAEDFFLHGNRKINFNKYAYKKFEIPLKSEGLTAEEIAAGIHKLHKLALRNIELNTETKEVFILGSAANTLGWKYLEEKDVPELATKKSYQIRKKPRLISTAMEIEKEETVSSVPIQPEKQIEIASSTIDTPMDDASTDTFLLLSPNPNEDVVPSTTNSLDIATTPEVSVANVTPALVQESPTEKSGNNYQPAFFQTVRNSGVSFEIDQKKDVVQLKRSTLSDSASSAKKRKSEEINEELVAEFEEQQKYKEKIIKKIQPQLEKITKDCDTLEKYSQGILKDYAEKEGWGAIIKEGRDNLPKESEQLKDLEVPRLNKLYTMIKKLNDTNSKANIFLKESTKNTKPEYLTLSSDSENEDKSDMEHSTHMFI